MKMVSDSLDDPSQFLAYGADRGTAISSDKFMQIFDGNDYKHLFEESSWKKLGPIRFPQNMKDDYRHIKLASGREVDMLHFLVVGRWGYSAGIANEVRQYINNSKNKSAFYPQDLYSNYLGVEFFRQYNSRLFKHPDKISKYIHEYLSNPKNTEIGEKK